MASEDCYGYLLFRHFDVLPTGRRQSKTLIQSKNANQKSLETVFYIAICQMTIKTLFLIILDLRSAIV